MPSEQRVRPDDRRDLTQGLTAHPVGSRGQRPPVVIGESETPPTQLPPQDPILLDQVRQHLALLLVQPAGDREQQHLEGRDVDHVRELTSPRFRMAHQGGRGVGHYGTHFDSGHRRDRLGALLHEYERAA